MENINSGTYDVCMDLVFNGILNKGVEVSAFISDGKLIASSHNLDPIQRHDLFKKIKKGDYLRADIRDIERKPTLLLGRLYFIQMINPHTDDFIFKAGVTMANNRNYDNSVTERLKGIQTANPYKLKKIAVIKVDVPELYIFEKEVHEILEQADFVNSLNGEWFSVCKERIEDMFDLVCTKTGRELNK